MGVYISVGVSRSFVASTKKHRKATRQYTRNNTKSDKQRVRKNNVLFVASMLAWFFSPQNDPQMAPNRPTRHPWAFRGPLGEPWGPPDASRMICASILHPKWSNNDFKTISKSSKMAPL